MSFFEWFLSLINLNIPTEISNPFDFVWNMWLDIYEVLTSLVYYYLAEFTIPVINITTSLYELTFGVGLIGFLILALLATIIRMYKDYIS